MKHPRTPGCSPKARRPLLLEQLEDRYAPAAGLLGGTGLDSLVSATLAPVVTAPLVPSVAPAVGVSSTTFVASTPAEANATPDAASADRGHSEMTPGEGLIGSLLGSVGTVVQSVTPIVVIDLVSGQNPPTTPVSSGSQGGSTSGTSSSGSDGAAGSTGDPVSNVTEPVGTTVTEGTILLNRTLPTPVLNTLPTPVSSSPAPGSTSEASSGSSADKAELDPNSSQDEKPGAPEQAVLLTGSPTLVVGSLETAPGIPMTAIAPQGLTFGNGIGLAQNPGTLLPGSVILTALNGQDSWAGAPTGLGQAMLSTWPQGTPWWSLSGSSELPATGNGLVGPRAEVMATGEEASPLLTAASAELDALLPLSSGLVQAADDLGAMERAFQEFLSGLAELRQTMSSWLARVGPLPWVLMGLAVAATVYDEASRRRWRLPRKAEVTPATPAGVD